MGRYVANAAAGFCLAVAMFSGCAQSQPMPTAVKSGAVERPDASAIIKKDALKPTTKYTMPAGCVTQEKAAFENGRILFNELSNESGKYAQHDKKKQYGNCVACHNIEKAVGHGNLGPDLSRYGEVYIKSGARDAAFLYQKIADPRVDNPNTPMTVNLTTGLLSEREICDLVSYIIATK